MTCRNTILRINILPLIDRVEELGSLEKAHSRKGFSFIVIYGRRRVGKTYLLKRFLSDKDGFYFLCDKAGTGRNTLRLRKHMAHYLDEPEIASEDIEDLFINLNKKVQGRIVIVLDEFSYLVEKDDSIPSVFQRIIDEVISDSQMMLILCGSSISMMEEGVLSKKSPLYGRRTGKMRVDPIPFPYLREFLPEYDQRTLVETQAVFGSVPYYLRTIDPARSLEENIIEVVMSKDGNLYEETDLLLKTEMREPDVYKAIVGSIAEGNTRLVDISNATGIAKNDLPKYTGKLMSLGILDKEYSVIDNKKARPLYRIDDNLFNFWFTFCEALKSDLEIGYLDAPVENFHQRFQTYVDGRFESLIRNELMRKGLPFSPSKIGRFWFKENEIDAVAIDQSRKRAAFIEIKWSDVDPGRELKALDKKIETFPWTFKEYYLS
ncbi:MAG: ATP-binding protein [Candidatus Thermoplasmatota archaeon]|nr:ATP-binding protein [Candidatus Thermoplasmatota archaeon]